MRLPADANAASQIYNALIRTHHITSRKKVARLRKAAHRFALHHVLLRSGGSPGLMYAEGSEEGVRGWVGAVQGLRYKDYHCLYKPAPADNAASPQRSEKQGGSATTIATMGFEEVESVASFGSEMEKRGLLGWWKRAMGYSD